MGRFMTTVPAAIVAGAIIGVIVNQAELTEDQSLGICFMVSIAILYTTRNIE